MICANDYRIESVYSLIFLRIFHYFDNDIMPVLECTCLYTCRYKHNKPPLNKNVIASDSYPQNFKKNRMRWTEPKDLNLIIIKLSEIFNIDKDIIVENIYNNSKKILRL